MLYGDAAASLPLSPGQAPPAPLTQAEIIALLPSCTRCGQKFLRERATCNTCGEWSPAKQKLHPSVRRQDDSPMRAAALKIVAMRGAGVSDEEISVALGLSKATISGYLYKAGKNGWLDFDDPKDSLEYRLLHKVIRNLDELLDSPNEEVKTEVTLKTAEGTLFKKFNDLSGGQQPQQTLVGVKVEIVGGTALTVREGTVMGTGHYVDADTPEEP